MKAGTTTTKIKRRGPASPLPPQAQPHPRGLALSTALPSSSSDSPHDDDHHDEASGLASPPLSSTPSSPRQHHAAPFVDQKFCGFTFNFSNNVPGMLYRSRNDPRSMACPLKDAPLRAPDPSSQDKSKAPRDQATTGAGSLARKASSSDDAVADDDEAGFAPGDVSGMMAPEKLDLRQRMALTLRNWCLDKGNMALIAREGAIQALAALASREDRLTRRFCAAAFYSLSHNPDFRAELVQVGACAIIAQVALNTKSPRVALSCATSLCNLSLESSAEPRLAEEGAVGALCTLLLTFSERDVWVTSLQGLYNLTCVTESYQGLDRVLKGLLSAYDTPCQELDPSQIVGLAIANLSVIHRMRMRILEEGLVDVMTRHILPFADGALRYNVAVALHNVACARACSGEMINRGIMSCIVSLTRPPLKSSSRTSMFNRGAVAKDDGEQQILSQQPQQHLFPLLACLATTLQYLSLEVEARRKTIQDGAVRAILNILEQTAEPSVLEACAEALHAFTSFGDNAVLLIKYQAVPALIKLSDTLLASSDPQRRRQRHSVVASFCNLLSTENHHGSVLDYKSCLTCVLRLAECLDGDDDSICSEDEVLLEYLSCLYSNLACGTPRRFQAVMAGLVPRLVQLCDLTAPPAVSIKLKSRCATALANLMAIATTGGSGSSGSLTKSSSIGGGSTSTGTTNGVNVSKQQNNNNLVLKRMVQDGVVGCLGRLLVASTDEVLLESVTTALALTSFHHDDVKAEMIKQGIVHALIRAVTDEVLRGDKTQHAAAAIFASLSYSAQHIPHLFEAGVLDAIFLLAKTEETATRKRCATVLCNLSYDPHVRNHMVERNVVLLLAQLSNTYSDETQMDCAWCFCNLACGGGAGAEEVARTTLNRDTMVKQGAVGSLLMIALVRAVTTQTREVCARALLNLITEGTTAKVIDDGITQGLASLCGLDSEMCLQICAQAFWTLSLYPVGRAKIASKRNIMQGLCSLIRSDVVTTRTLCGATVMNLLLLEADTAVLATEAGALGVVKVMCTSGDAAVQVECAHAIAKIAPLAACRAHMPKESIPQAMVLLAQQNQDEATAVAALRALTCLALSHFPLAVLLQAGILHVVIYRVLSSVFLGADAGGDGISGGDGDEKKEDSRSSSSGNSGRDVIESCVHILYRFALSKELRLAMTKTQVVCAVVVLLWRVGAWKVEKPQQAPRALLLETMLATTLERLSWIPASQHHIVEDGGMLALVELVKRRHDAPPPYGARLAKSIAIVFANLARAEGRRLHLVSVGVIEALTIVLKKGFLLEAGVADKKDVVAWRAVLGLLQLSESSDDLLVAMALNGALELLVFIILSASGKVGERSEVLQRYAAGALCNFSHCQECRPLLAAQAGAVEAIMNLSKSPNATIQRHCSIMLANLSGQQHAKLRVGSVGTLVNLFKSQDRHEKTRPSLEGGRDNKKGAIQAKFRRLLMAATLAKELNDGTKETAAGAAAAGPGAESNNNGTSGDGAEGVDTEQKVQDEGDEGERSDKEDDEDEGTEDEEKNWHAYHVRATHLSGSLPTTRLVDMVSLVTQQQQARLASWDMTPPAHETVFYKCSHSGASSCGVAPVSSTSTSTSTPLMHMDSSSLSSQEGVNPSSPASPSSSSLAPPTSSAAPSYQVRNVIAVSHPKLSECPALRPRQAEKLKGAATTTVAYLMERRKSSFLPGASNGALAPGATLAPATDNLNDKPSSEEKPAPSMEGAAVTKAVKWFTDSSSRSAPRPSYPPAPKHAVTKPDTPLAPAMHPTSPPPSSSADTVNLVLAMGRMEQSLLAQAQDSHLTPTPSLLLPSPVSTEPQAAAAAPAAAPSSSSPPLPMPSSARRFTKRDSHKVDLVLLEEAFSYGGRGRQEQKKGGEKKKGGK